ncbi:pyridoxamine 5'-phosphate oxidase family protein [Catenulispora yoronensis]|uniref:Pyridoxamine 5'-phosphate oxidase family protein n=1 Tax=Catenulispora yoronensis TaxID=450799 RepID=A0ABP5GE15_9ACTN
MSQAEPTVEFNGDFSEPGATARPWAEVAELLSSSEMFWLSTVRGDGRPHVVPLPTVWLDGVLHFATGPGEQKAVNLRSNSHCVLSTGANHFREGLDVVVEGDAVRVTDRSRLEQLAVLWKSKLDWTYEVTDDAFRDEDGPSGDILVFAVVPAKILAFGKSPYSQTRYRYGN